MLIARSSHFDPTADLGALFSHRGYPPGSEIGIPDFMDAGIGAKATVLDCMGGDGEGNCASLQA